MGVFVYPFNAERVKYEGANSIVEFRDWVYDYGFDFAYSQPVAQSGDVLVFAWIEKPGEWYLVGDSIIKDNHKWGDVPYCSCDVKSIYERHIITGGVRLYPTNVCSKDINMKLGSFSKIDPETYVNLLRKTVSHW
ncbi:MAG: hypothetical protein ACYDAP_07570 [Thermoplasmataceae archaeon]